MGMGSSFNKTSWQAKGEVFGSEMRAFNNLNWHRTTNDGNDFIGLTGYGPNVMYPIPRDLIDTRRSYTTLQYRSA